MSRQSSRRILEQRLARQRLTVVALLTVVTVLGVIFVVRDVALQPVLVTSLASSTFLLYYQPLNEINRFRPLIFGHLIALGVGYLSTLLLPVPYASAATSIAATTILVTLLRAVHPPALSTSLIFSYRPHEIGAAVTFLLSLLVVVVLAAVYLLVRLGLRNARLARFLWDSREGA